MAIVNSLIELISKGSLTEVFEVIPELTNKLPDDNTKNTLVHLSGRFHSVQQQNQVGTISNADYQLETNKIRQSLIEVINGIPAELLPNVNISVGGSGSSVPPTKGPNGNEGNGSATTPPNHFHWSVYIGIGLALLITALIVFIPCPTSSQYEVFHTFLALCAAGLGAVIPGFLNVEYKGVLRAGGALALFVLVFWGGPDLAIAEGKCANEPFDLVLRLRPEAPNAEYPPLVGAQLWLWVGDDWEKRDINADQVVEFKNLAPNLHGKKAEVQLKAQYYRLPMDSITLTPDSKPIKVAPNWALSKVQGKARLGAGGSFLQGVLIEVEGVKDTTDALGNFEINVPPARQKEKYTLYASKIGFALYENYVHPAGGKIEVPMTKKK